jgi:hypothetical protein
MKRILETVHSLEQVRKILLEAKIAPASGTGFRNAAVVEWETAEVEVEWLTIAMTEAEVEVAWVIIEAIAAWRWIETGQAAEWVETELELEVEWATEAQPAVGWVTEVQREAGWVIDSLLQHRLCRCRTVGYRKAASH